MCQAFCAVCEPVFERGFIHDSYANRKGKGTHRAIARYEAFRDRFRYVLRCDIYRYFPAIDHEIIKADIRRRIACHRTLALSDRIIDGSNPQTGERILPRRQPVHPLRAAARAFPSAISRASSSPISTTLTTPAGVIGFDMVKALFRSHHAGSWGSGATLMRKTELAASPGWSANHIKERDRK